MSKEKKSGTFIHGIAASQHLDSSGERIVIEGVDISSLTKDGILNWEHKNENASQIVGKILEAKKILKKQDCDTDAQRYFWDKIKTPYVYVAGELFDHVGHTASMDVAAMLRYDKTIDVKKTNKLINFSIEGSRLGKKQGSMVPKCIARKVTITITPCNKAAEAELLDKDSDIYSKKMKDPMDILNGFKKTEEVEIEVLAKSAGNYYKQLWDKNSSKYNASNKPNSKQNYKPIGATSGEQREGSTIKPKREFSTSNAPEKMKVGDRVHHVGPKKPRTGHSIYNDPDTWKSESNVRKAIVAGCGLGAPSSKVDSSSLSKEDLSGETENLTKKSLKKSMVDDCWSRFKHKEKLIDIISNKNKSLSKKEIENIAKEYSYLVEKKEEKKLKDLIKKDDVNLKSKHKSPKGGLNQAGRDKYNKETGGNLKAPVSAKAAKKSPKKAKRRKSFCARMSGVEGPNYEYKDTDRDGKKEKVKTRKKKALDRWDC